MDKFNQAKIRDQKFTGHDIKTFQFYKKDKSYMRGKDIAEVLDNLEKAYQKKGIMNARFHILGVHTTGEKELKSFDEDYDEDEFIDYFKNKVQGWKHFDDFFQVEISVDVPTQKHKYKF